MPAASSKRKHGAAFKAPRTSTSTSKTGGPSSRKPARKSNASRREPSSDEEDELLEDGSDDSGDQDGGDISDAEAADASDPDSTSSALAQAASTTLKQLDTNPPPSIPPKLLAKILHHNLEANNASKSMRIDKDAMSTLGRYIETFTREAIARAAFERGEANAEREKRGEKIGAGESFLEVEDLEKLAPQLLLDF